MSPCTGAVNGLQVIQSCLSVLQGGHDRSKLPAAQVLVALSEQPALVPRLDPVMPTLLKLLSGSGVHSCFPLACILYLYLCLSLR